MHRGDRPAQINREKWYPLPPSFLPEGGGGGRHIKISGSGEGTPPDPGTRGVPPPLHAITPPPFSCAEGVGPPPPPVGHSTRNAPFGTGSKGGGPLFCAEQGGWGSVLQNGKPGGRGLRKFRRGPPLPGSFGEGWEVMTLMTNMCDHKNEKVKKILTMPDAGKRLVGFCATYLPGS